MMMPTDIKDYVKVYDFIDEKSCKKLVTSLKKSKEWSKHSYYDAVSGVTNSFDDDLEISYDLKEDKKLLMDKLWHSIDTYIRKDMKFSDNWFNNWSGYSPIRWNRYKVGTRMQPHCDHIQNMFDGVRKGIPILSILGSLNDNYEGGELLFWGDEKIELKTGQIIIFPSNFMYPHEVKPITKGTRYSFVSWVW